MAEKPSELEKLENSDAAATDDKFLQTRANEASIAEADSDEAPDEAEEIREQIVETRRGMSETIDAIQEKLSFANISEQVKDQVSEQIGGAVDSVKQAAFDKAEDFANIVNKGVRKIKKSDAVKTAQENPWLLSLVGVGIGALVVNGLVGKKKKRAKHIDKSDHEKKYELGNTNVMKYREDYKPDFKSGETEEKENRSAFDKTDEAKNPASGIISNAASSTYESISNAASSAYEGVSGAAETAYESVGGAAGKTYKGVSKAAGFAYDKAGDLGGHVKTNYDYYIEENPLIVGAAALAIGAAVGMAIPLTKAENQYFGEIRDNAVGKIHATAQDAIGTAKQVVGEAQKAFVDEIKS